MSVPSLQPDTDRYLRFLAIGIFILVGCLVLNNHFNWVDDAYYILLGKALASGQGYRDINLPIPLTHRNFPPGLPWLLTLPSWLGNLFGLSFDIKVIIFKLLLISCGALALYLFGYLASEAGYSHRQISWAILISASSIAFVSYTYRVASEMLYVLLSVLTIIAVQHYEKKARLSGWLLLCGLLLAATILTRTIGVTLLGAVLLNWLLRREFGRICLLLILITMLLLPWFWKSGSGGSGTTRYFTDMLLQYQATDSSATSPLIALINRAKTNSWLIINQEIPRIIFSISASSFVTERGWLNLPLLPVRLAITLLTLTPLLSRLWPRPSVIQLYLLSYLAIVVVWPWEPSRFLIPLNPFFCLLFISSLERLLSWCWQQGQRIRAGLPDYRRQLMIAIVGILFFSHLTSDLRFILTVWRTGDYTPEAAQVWNDTMAAYQWIKNQAPASSVIACAPTIEAHTYLFTDRKAVPLPAQLESCRKLQVTHIILINDGPINGNGVGLGESDLKRLIKRTGSRDFLIPSYQNNNVTVFTIDQARMNKLLELER